MSFSVSDPSIGLEYRGTNLNTLYAQRRNLLRPWFHRMLVDIVRFNRSARRLLAEGGDRAGLDLSLDEFLAEGGYSRAFIDRFLVPLGASIWSADPETFTRFPAAAYARFMDNHGLLDAAGHAPVAHRHRRLAALRRGPDRPVRRAHPVPLAGAKVVRHHDGEGGIEVELMSATYGPETFDRVILATHSDQALQLLSDASPAEHEILGAIRYQPNVATLHTDERFLPGDPRARASWNYHLGALGPDGEDQDRPRPEAPR